MFSLGNLNSPKHVVDSKGNINANQNEGTKDIFVSTPANDTTGFSLHKTVCKLWYTYGPIKLCLLFSWFGHYSGPLTVLYYIFLFLGNVSENKCLTNPKSPLKHDFLLPKNNKIINVTLWLPPIESRAVIPNRGAVRRYQGCRQLLDLLKF
jgi:hypothetical protein